MTPEEGRRELTVNEMIQQMYAEEMEVEADTIFRNYFESPRKPYIFLNYDQMGEHPLDATSRIEQVINLQKNVNKTGQQIEMMNERSKGKWVFNADMIEKETVESLDLNDPDQDVMVSGSARDAAQLFQSPPASSPIYQEQEQNRQRVFQKMGTNSTTRGVREGSETATARQLFREADYGKIDDLVEDTINAAAEQMADWAMQFIKLKYKTGKMRKLLGKDGDVTFTKITQDTVEDGAEVVMAASGVDRMEQKREAFERAGMQLTDPITFFIDTGASDPKGRAEKLLTFISSPELYMQKYVLNRDTQGMIDELNGQAPPQEEAPPAELGAGLPMGGGGGMENDPLGLFQ